MAGWAAYYPTQASPTANFVPSKQPTAEGSSYEKDRGILSERAADGSTQYDDRINDGFRTYNYTFNDLPFDEYLDFETFETAVGGGSFQFRESDDADCGIVLSFRTVRFAPGYKPTFQPSGGGLGSLTVQLVDS
jgi:hypothetical protein